jgi:hypothetical protein
MFLEGKLQKMNLISKYPLRNMFFKSYSFEEHQVSTTTTLMPSNKYLLMYIKIVVNPEFNQVLICDTLYFNFAYL